MPKLFIDNNRNYLIRRELLLIKILSIALIVVKFDITFQTVNHWLEFLFVQKNNSLNKCLILLLNTTFDSMKLYLSLEKELKIKIEIEVNY